MFLTFFIGCNKINSYSSHDYFNISAKDFVARNYQYFFDEMWDLELVNNFGCNYYLGCLIDQMEINIFIITNLVKLKFLLKN